MDLTLDYLTRIENNEYLGIFEKIDLNQKSPIELPKMTRKNLARLFRHLRFRIGVEVGVEKGLYSSILCKCNPQMKLYSVDAWTPYKGYRGYVSQGRFNKLYDEAKERLAFYNNCEVVKAFSMDAVKQFKNGSLDFVYIDGSHEFQQVTNDIAEWSKKVRKGGIVSGHDFRRGAGKWTCHVKDVVQAWTYSHRIRPWFVLRGDKSPTWFWVKL